MNKISNNSNRIYVNGEWYVKESAKPKIDVYITEAKTFTYEIKDYCWEAVQLIRDNGTPFDDIYVKFTNKIIKPWKEEVWDNTSFLKHIAKGNDDAITTALETMNSEGVDHFQAFLQELINKGIL